MLASCISNFSKESKINRNKSASPDFRVRSGVILVCEELSIQRSDLRYVRGLRLPGTSSFAAGNH